MAAEETSPLGRCGNYELLVELAAGGMATVYLARLAEGGRDAPLVAIKRPHRHLAKDKAFLSMLVDEARLASAIEHGHVVKVRELGFEAGEPFIVLDYIEGAALSEIRRELSAIGRTIDARVAVRIGLDVLAGLQAAHVLHDDRGKHLGIVHRDVSPHNILIGCDGLARVTDFGIAKAADRVQVTQTHEVKGKLAYLAPERVDRRRLCTVQSDVFSTAVVIWECIAGRRLFRGDAALETLQEVMTGPIPPLRRIGVPVPEALDAVILRGLARELGDRYKTAAEFAAALERSGGGRGGVAAHAEVASLLEALFGERLRVRHATVREVFSDRREADHILEVSGLSPRAAPTPEMREREQRQLENVAPPAPSARYAFGATENLEGSFLGPRARRGLAIAGGAVAATVVAAVFFARPAPAPATATAPATEPPRRHVVVPLPFPATRVAFDEQTREVSPPADVVAFDVSGESGPRHRVTAFSADGARAEGFVRESEGLARPEGDGFAIESLDTYPDGPSPSAATSGTPVRHPARAPRPIGSVKDGFTRLR